MWRVKQLGLKLFCLSVLEFGFDTIICDGKK